MGSKVVMYPSTLDLFKLAIETFKGRLIKAEHVGKECPNSC